MTDDLPAVLVERCAKRLSYWWLLGGTRFEVPARAILREAGVAEMAKALEEARPFVESNLAQVKSAFPHFQDVIDPPTKTVAAIDAALSRYRTGEK
jgi:hypothetical protein